MMNTQHTVPKVDFLCKNPFRRKSGFLGWNAIENKKKCSHCKGRFRQNLILGQNRTFKTCQANQGLLEFKGGVLSSVAKCGKKFFWVWRSCVLTMAMEWFRQNGIFNYKQCFIENCFFQLCLRLTFPSLRTRTLVIVLLRLIDYCNVRTQLFAAFQASSFSYFQCSS